MNTPHSIALHGEVPVNEVLRTLGCPPNHKLSGRMQRQIETAIHEVCERATCRWAFRRYAMRLEPGRVWVDGATVLRSTRLVQALRPCEQVYVYVVTLGPEVDAYIDEAMDDRRDYGVIVDATASVAAESLVDRIEEEIGESLPPSQALTLPYSPGHCDWSVHEQHKIFSLLPPGAAGVTLSPDSMMSPRKSITGVVGAGPVAAVTQAECPCASCARLECGHRRRPYTGSQNEGINQPRLTRPQRGRTPQVPLRTARRR